MRSDWRFRAAAEIGSLPASLLCCVRCVLAAGRAASSAGRALKDGDCLVDFVAFDDQGLEDVGCGHGGTG